MTHEEDDEVARRLTADAEGTAPPPADLWDAIEADLDRGGLREAVVARPTPQRQLLGTLGVVATGVALVALQGVRQDLDAAGWQQFAVGAVPLALGGLAASQRALAPRGRPLTWAGLGIVGAWLWMVGLAAVAPWPGMRGVPISMHAYCFGMTSLAVVLSTVGLSWLDRGRTPVAWRVGLSGAGAGAVAFVFQSVFCPGVDWLHLVVGHGGAGIVWALVGMALALVLRR